MTSTDRSPVITRLRWGRIDIEGGRRFKDAKLYPGGARAWDWAETGTDHHPGIQPDDVQELLDHGARAVVLSTGMLRRLKVMPETLDLLGRLDVPAHVAPTPEAVRRYNELASGEPVGGLFHSTC